MIKAKVGFVVYGVHKDGLKDPDGNLFIDYDIIERSRKALRDSGLTLVEGRDVLEAKGIKVEHDNDIVATKKEANEIILPMAKDDSIDCLVLFSGTWVWAAHMIGAIREFAKTGKGIVIWTYPGSQGWRPVGGLVLKAALNEIGLKCRYVYGKAEDPKDLNRILSYCQASAVKNHINNTTMGAFGGRGMGQTCGVADPAQWMKTFGIDIDSRDTTELLETARAVTAEEIDGVYEIIKKRFIELPERNDVTERSIRLYVALKKLMKENDFDYYTIQSFPGLGDDYVASCFAQSMMLDDGVPTSTLSDFNTAMTSILMTYLSEDPIYYGDFQCINKENNEIKIIGDGAVPTALANEDGAVFASHGIPTEGKAGGMSIKLTCKEGKGVLGRVCRVDGKFTMVVTRCTVRVPSKEELAVRRHECGIPDWPHAFCTAECDIDTLLEHWNNEYACLGYGEHLYQELIDFAELTGMTVYAL